MQKHRHTHNRHKLPTHTLQTTGTLAASKHPGLPKASSLISVHAGTLPFSPVSVPPCDPVWVSPGLSSIPGALPTREPRWPDPCPSQPVTRHPATASLLRLLKLPAGGAPVHRTALGMSNTQKTPAESRGKDGRRGKVGSLGWTCTRCYI